uniref:Ig-like domain-containing protein n=1 Tax=Taeniopygia guttata TaxID=59729 RepID=A0A674GYL3_TAEGU
MAEKMAQIWQKTAQKMAQKRPKYGKKWQKKCPKYGKKWRRKCPQKMSQMWQKMVQKRSQIMTQIAKKMAQKRPKYGKKWPKNDPNVAQTAPGAALPPVPRSGTFLRASRLGMEPEEGKSRQPFRCWARHGRGGRSVEVSNPGPGTSGPAPPPELSLRPPSREDFQGPYRNSTLLCQIRGRRRGLGAAPIRWYRNGAPVSDGVTAEPPAAESSGGVFVAGSRVVVTEAEWESGVVFTCRAGDEMRNTSKAMECGCDQSLSAGDIRVETVPPQFADIFRDRSARLTCRVTNVPAAADGLEVTWLKEDGQVLATKTSSPAPQPDGLLAAEGVAEVGAELWESGQTFTCRVAHPELLFPKEVTMRKTLVPSPSPPSIHLLPPPPEQLRDRTWATLTCLVRDFNPPEILLQWLHDGRPLPPGHALTWRPRPEPGPTPRGHAPAYLSVSTLTVPARDWESGGVFTCLVGHERLPLRLAQKSLDKAAGKPTNVNVSLVFSDSASACY